MTKLCLLIEDMEPVRETTRLMLQTLGYDCIAVSDGVQGITEINQDIERFDLIITDILMPESDGLEVLRTIQNKRSSNTDVPPVIACSGGGTSFDVDAYKPYATVLCDVFLNKPFTAEELCDAIEQATL